MIFEALLLGATFWKGERILLLSFSNKFYFVLILYFFPLTIVKCKTVILYFVDIKLPGVDNLLQFCGDLGLPTVATSSCSE